MDDSAMTSFLSGAVLGIAALVFCFTGPIERTLIPLAPLTFVLDKAKAVSLQEGRRDPCPDAIDFGVR